VTLLVVTAHMQTPVSMPNALHLESVLMATRPSPSSVRLQRSTPIEDIEDPAIPVARITVRGHVVYMCSAAMLPDETAVAREWITKRKDPTDAFLLDAPYSVSSGPDRNYCLPVPVHETATLAWVCVGNRKTIRSDLRRYCTQLGAKRRNGLGRVARWECERLTEGSPEDVLLSGGRARRFLPAAWCEWHSGAEVGPCRPPYWHPARWIERVVPGARCVLRDDVLAAARRLR
jgi:hypothetical protein